MPPVPSPDPSDPRTRHFGTFYGLDDVATDADDDRPVALVIGNCQAESLRIMLDAGDLVTVRVPAVHELTEHDLPHLDRWLARTDLLISQPIRDDYHSLPLGTRQLAARLPTGGRLLRVPVVRFAGLYPWHVIVRPPSDPGLTPPVVEYHDVRLLLEAAGEAALPPLDRRRVLGIAEASLEHLARREQAHGTIVLSDLFARPRFEQMRTLNHPGNSVWTAAAARVRDVAGLPENDVDPGRPLLDSVHAPRDPAVVDAFALGDEPTRHWLVGGTRIDLADVREAHLEWYARNPEAVRAGLDRHVDTLRVLAA
ncbi:WcbI family polysaccharide biosynthesis putative acetyltransferase [Herbiconiux sp. L3-i23]|uniref:WcbI family polysaccharide biosynthesis putative acetyltransferase n=1 Tax=Herbiconiux sp. L3-i23 TaxID=2905871 RepID=UPI00205C06CE|nr:WcbI family polysaccharide biosynthesis putative acetyltransferase [Herbiconiux sp. L3-i23]BDI24040.1 hypothetical protein L3i23_28160 [Herbiconiux sp. L3-i23]